MEESKIKLKLKNKVDALKRIIELEEADDIKI